MDFSIRADGVILEVSKNANGYIDITIRTVYDNTYRHALQLTMDTWSDVVKTLEYLEMIVNVARTVILHKCVNQSAEREKNE